MTETPRPTLRRQTRRRPATDGRFESVTVSLGKIVDSLWRIAGGVLIGVLLVCDLLLWHSALTGSFRDVRHRQPSVDSRKNVLLADKHAIMATVAGPERFPADSPAPLPLPTTITVKAAGDIVPGTDFPFRRLPERREALFENVLPALQGADILFGNFESTLTRHPRSAKNIARPRVFAFRTPPEFAGLLQRAGFDVLNVANNHSMDFAETGFDDTVAHIRAAGMDAVGMKAAVVCTAVRGMPVAFIGFDTGPRHNSLNDLESAAALAAEAGRHADIVVVSFHGGAEGSGATRTRNVTERFCGENRGNVVRFDHEMIDAGADLILGHGPHVVRGLEIYKGKLIAYSLGNFVGYKTLSTRWPLGCSFILEAVLDRKGDFLRGRIIPVFLDKNGIPHPDPEGSGLKLVERLTRRDFPETLLVISANGEMTTGHSCQRPFRPVARALSGSFH